MSGRRTKLTTETKTDRQILQMLKNFEQTNKQKTQSRFIEIVESQNLYANDYHGISISDQIGEYGGLKSSQNAGGGKGVVVVSLNRLDVSSFSIHFSFSYPSHS